MKIGIMGHGRAGKDEAAELLVREFGLRYAGSTSVVISRDIARRDGITFEEAHAQRHARREEWRAHGDRMRENDPAALVRGLLPETDLVVGVRAACEIDAVIAEGLLDVIFWVDNPRVEDDPTLEFGPEKCDAVVMNHWGLKEYHRRWRVIARSLGLG